MRKMFRKQIIHQVSKKGKKEEKHKELEKG
jgi:hypothetical protein